MSPRQSQTIIIIINYSDLTQVIFKKVQIFFYNRLKRSMIKLILFRYVPDSPILI